MSVVMEGQEDEQVPEEVVETTYMCGECFLLFSSTEDFNAHQCQESEVQTIVQQDGSQQILSVPLEGSEDNPCLWKSQESEAVMEEAVANILGEKLKKMTTPKNASLVFDHIEMSGKPSIEHTGIVDQQMESVVEHMVENKESVEIPSANIYMYDNPIYLNRLMKDNTFGRRVRHDATYRQRLGPWDNKSSRLLINLLKDYPKAYFIMDKECKRTEAWEMIRNKMAECNYQFTVLQIRMRWRELVKNYRTTINYNDTQNVRRSCQFFDELNELFGVWDYKSTVILIKQMELHGTKRLGQNGGVRMRFKVWNHIRIILESHGYNFTADQVQGRWSTLVNLYQKMVENNSKPHTEKITVAFVEHIERVFNYVPERNSKWKKIMEKRGKIPKALKRNWSHPTERELLTLYQNRIYRFNNEHIDNNTLWEEIVQHLKEEIDYITTVEKAKVRFIELTKQFATVEKHNAQTGTIRRESKHHELLSEIYNVYNYWPHDKSVIKLNKSNNRMRQVYAQLAWSEEQSQAVLQLYPQVLVSHLSSGDHQPLDEFWLQLAKAYLNSQGDRKQCYEIEEHIALLRRGHHSSNPFPFASEMQILEETEVTLGFSPDPVVTEKDQLIPYWSHNAAILLLDLIIMYRKEGMKNTGSFFEMISIDLKNLGFRYSGEECRVYYSLLRQLYTNRQRTLKRNKSLLKPFPYMDKMAEVDAVVSMPKFIETDKNRQIVIAASSAVIGSLDPSEEVKDLEKLTDNIRIRLNQDDLIQPMPSSKKIGEILRNAIKGQKNSCVEVMKLREVLKSNLSNLILASDESYGKGLLKPATQDKGGKRVKTIKKSSYGRFQDHDIETMLEVINDWRLLCHDQSEFEAMLSVNNPLWKEVASRLKPSFEISPNKCYERFTKLCREYKSVMAFNARLEMEEPHKSVPCQERLQHVLAPLVFHEAEIDPRDLEWMGEKSSISSYETIELLFTIKELSCHILKADWESNSPNIDWNMVSMFMRASGFHVSKDDCRNKFEDLFKSYEATSRYNQMCTLKNRKRSPFYFKIRSLFMNLDVTKFEPDPAEDGEIEVDELEAQKALVHFLKKIKTNQCHSVPRRSLLLSLAQLLDEQFMMSSPTFTAHQVWHMMVQLHVIHQEAFLHNYAVDLSTNLDEVWQNHPCPLVAYNLLASPVQNWRWTIGWSLEEMYLLNDAVLRWELQPLGLKKSGEDNNVSKSASEALQKQGFNKSPKQCCEQWNYVSSVYGFGGYSHFADQLCLLYSISPLLLPTRSLDKTPTGKGTSNYRFPEGDKNSKQSRNKKPLTIDESCSLSRVRTKRKKDGDTFPQTVSNSKDVPNVFSQNIPNSKDEPNVFPQNVLIKDETQEILLNKPTVSSRKKLKTSTNALAETKVRFSCPGDISTSLLENSAINASGNSITYSQRNLITNSQGNLVSNSSKNLIINSKGNLVTNFPGNLVSNSAVNSVADDSGTSKTTSPATAVASAPGHFSTYVHVNVPKKSRSIQVSINKLVQNSDRHDISNYVKGKSEHENKYIVKKGQTYVSHRKHVDQSSHGISEVDSKKYLKNHNSDFNAISEEAKVKVDVVRVIYNKKFKFVECRTQEKPSRRFLLKIPSNVPVPADIGKLLVPQKIAYSDVENEKGNLSHNQELDLIEINIGSCDNTIISKRLTDTENTESVHCVIEITNTEMEENIWRQNISAYGNVESNIVLEENHENVEKQNMSKNQEKVKRENMSECCEKVEGKNMLSEHHQNVKRKHMLSKCLKNTKRQNMSAGLENIKRHNMSAGLENVEGPSVSAGLENIKREDISAGLENIKRDNMSVGLENIKRENMSVGFENIKRENMSIGLENIEGPHLSSRLETVEKQNMSAGLKNVEKQSMSIGLENVESPNMSFELKKAENQNMSIGLENVEGLNMSSDHHEIVEILGMYRKRVFQERLNLMQMFKEIHSQQSSALKTIFTGFQEIHDCLAL